MVFHEIKAKQSRPTFAGPCQGNKLQCHVPDDFFQGIAVHKKNRRINNILGFLDEILRSW